jgi:hypothetical protein
MQTFEDLDILKTFFWNYSQEDINELCKDHRFYHFWNYKLPEYPTIKGMPETYVHLCLAYFDYFPNDMRLLILNYAKQKYVK